MNQPTTSEVIDKLSQASKGLQYMSEADYPFEVFQWEVQELPSVETVLQQTGRSLDTQVEVVSLEKFFQNATQEEDWYEQEEKETVKRYRELLTTLQQNLNNIQVYRLGTVEIDIYIVGQTPLGNLAGLVTKAIET